MWPRWGDPFERAEQNERIGGEGRSENQKGVNRNGKLAVFDDFPGFGGNLARCFSFRFRVSGDYDPDAQ